MRRAFQIAVIGAGDAPEGVLALAEGVGGEIAAHGAVLVCGGLGGVMAAAARGAQKRGGHTIGILPGTDPSAANSWIEFPIATGLGEARNAVVVGAADGVIALAGEGGTLAEIGFALKLRRPIVAVDAWRGIDGLPVVASPQEAVELVLGTLREPARDRRKS